MQHPIAAVAVLLALAAAPARAQTTGQAVNLTQAFGAHISTGPGHSEGGTLRVIMASDSPQPSLSFPAGALPVTSTYTVVVATGPNSPEKYLPIRLTDGSAFYTASGGGAVTQGGPFSVSLTTSGDRTHPLYTVWQGTNPVQVVGSTMSLNGIDLLATASGQTTGNGFLASLVAALTNPLPVSGPLTDAELRAAAVPVDGSGVTQPVSGTFWQATQPVSLASVPSHPVTNAGTFAVQAAQNGSYTVTPGTGTWAVSGPLTDTQLRATPVPVSGTVTVTPPASQYVTFSSGSASNPLYVQSNSTITVSVNNFPASQAVTGTFWQATQPISAAALPLPSGAATDRPVQTVSVAVDSTTAANPTHAVLQQSTITVVGVAGAAIAVSAASLPLPAGAATDRPIQTVSVAVDSTTRTNPTWVVTGATATVQVINSTMAVVGVNGAAIAISAASLPLPSGAATDRPIQTISVNVDSTTRTNPTWTVTGATAPVVVIGSTISVVGVAGAGVLAYGTMTVVGVAGAPIPVLISTLPAVSLTTGSVTAFMGGTWTVGNSAGSADIGTVHSSTMSVLESTSGVMGSVSLGNLTNKTTVFVSSFAATAATNGNSVVLSSRTTTAGKTFYLQHIDVRGFLTVPSSFTVVNLGVVTVQSPSLTVIDSNTFVNSSGQPYGTMSMDFAEPVPFTTQTTLSIVAKPNTATAVTWLSHLIGYEK